MVPVRCDTNGNSCSGSSGTEVPVYDSTGTTVGSLGGGFHIHKAAAVPSRPVCISTNLHRRFPSCGTPACGIPRRIVPARRFTGVWLGESQEACALLTMTNCPALRRHIYANLGRKGRARRLEPTNLLALSLPFPSPVRSHHLTVSRALRTDDSAQRRKFSELRISHVCTNYLSWSSFRCAGYKVIYPFLWVERINWEFSQLVFRETEVIMECFFYKSTLLQYKCIF